MCLNRAYMLSLYLKGTTGSLPTSTYGILVDGEEVGECQIRRRLGKSKDMPEGFGSHIYFEIKEEFRRKGYATEALQELLKEAKRLGLQEVMIVVSDENVPSRKVIESNGGVLLEKKQDLKGQLQRKYHVVLR